MEKCQIFTKWTKEFGDEMVAQYPYCKKVYLSQDSHYKNNLLLLEALANNPVFEHMQNEQDLTAYLSQNHMIALEKGIGCTIRQGQYSFRDNHVWIEDCSVIFLFEQESQLQDFSKHFPEEKEVEGISFVFPQKSEYSRLGNKLQTFLHEISLDFSTLKTFLDGTIVLRLETIEKSNIHTLQDKTKHPAFYRKDKKLKPIFSFVSAQPLPAEEVSQMLTDALFYLGVHSYSDYLYATKIDPTYTNTQLDILLVVEGD